MNSPSPSEFVHVATTLYHGKRRPRSCCCMTTDNAQDTIALVPSHTTIFLSPLLVCEAPISTIHSAKTCLIFRPFPSGMLVRCGSKYVYWWEWSSAAYTTSFRSSIVIVVTAASQPEIIMYSCIFLECIVGCLIEARASLFWGGYGTNTNPLAITDFASFCVCIPFQRLFRPLLCCTVLAGNKCTGLLLFPRVWKAFTWRRAIKKSQHHLSIVFVT